MGMIEKKTIIIYYKVTSKGVIIVGTKGSPRYLTIPERIEGMDVIAIGSYAFAVENKEAHQGDSQEDGIEELSLEFQEVQTILTAPEIQKDKTALMSISLPNTITIIGAYAFSGCSQLKKVYLSKNLYYIEEYGFAYCSNLEKIVFPKTLLSIGKYGFYYCKTLREIRLEEGLLTIGAYGFYNCRGLVKINIPSTTINIGTGLFLNCDSLYEIHFGQCKHLAHMISVLDQTLMLTIEFPEIKEKAQLLIPDFQYEYIEDTPARQFHQINYGTGHLFRQCIGNSEIDFRRYDEMFYLTKREDEAILVLLLVIGRVTYPYKLQANRRETYLSYLRNHLLWAVEYCINEDDLSTLKLFKEWGLYSAAEMPSIIALAQKKKKLEILSFFMEYQHKNFTMKNKTFTL